MTPLPLPPARQPRHDTPFLPGRSGPTALAKCREAVQFILQCMSMVESAGIGKLISSIPFNPEGGMSGLDPDLLWELTLNLVTRHCELVTAGHEQARKEGVQAGG